MSCVTLLFDGPWLLVPCRSKPKFPNANPQAPKKSQASSSKHRPTRHLPPPCRPLIYIYRRFELHRDVVLARVHPVAAIQVLFELVNPGQEVSGVGLRVEVAAGELDVNRVRVRLLRSDGEVRHWRATHARSDPARAVERQLAVA